MTHHDDPTRFRPFFCAMGMLAALGTATPAFAAHETYQLRGVGFDDATSIDDDGRVTANEHGPQPQPQGHVLEGSIVTWAQVGSYIEDLDSSGGLVGSYLGAFLFDFNLHTLAGADLVAISDTGVGVGSRSPFGVTEAIEWDGFGAATVLALPQATPQVWTQAEAFDISPSGRYVVGRAFNANNSQSVAVVWDRQLGTVDVAPNVGLGVQGSTWSQARAVNDAGEVVGFIGQQTVMWTVNAGIGAPMNLGSPPTGMTACYPTAINESGVVVGECNLYTEAFIWHPGDVALTSLVGEMDPATGSGWTLHVAYDINELGQIVGRGTNPAGAWEGFVLSPDSACLLPCTFADGTTLDLPKAQCGDLGGDQPWWAVAACPVEDAAAHGHFPFP